MLRKLSILIISMFFLAFLLDGLAEAGRLGGGRSFGSRPSYQRSYQRPAAPQQQPSQTQPQQGVAGRPGGLFGGFGGMLGGLLMGGLLGSLLFGGGMRGVAGPGLLDILVIAGGLYLLFRYMRSRRTAAQDAGATYYEAGVPPAYDREKTGTAWGGISRAEEAAVPRIPPDFKVDEFMKGAKAAYNRLQDSWNRRDLEDIRQFTSPEIWEEINRQALAEPAPGKTEILLINAKLLEVSSEGEDTVASVYFDVLMRETPEEERPKQVREVWHFSRKANMPGSFWRLEGIQQMEE
jgi:predicted lipid-binding transport protein (Tim44 family)